MQELCDAYADARGRRGGVHLILGDPGVGKTRLATALAEHASADGATVVWTRGWGRAAPAYWPWVEVVRGLTKDIDGATLRAELGAAADAPRCRRSRASRSSTHSSGCCARAARRRRW